MAPDQKAACESRPDQKQQQPTVKRSSLAGLRRALRSSVPKRCAGKRIRGAGCQIFPRRKKHDQKTKATAPLPMGSVPEGDVCCPLPPRLQLLRMFQAVLFVTRLRRLRRESLRDKNLRAVGGSPSKHPKLSLPLCESVGTTPCSTPAAASRVLGSAEIGGCSASPESPTLRRLSPSRSRLSWSLSPVNVLRGFQHCGSGVSDNASSTTPKACDSCALSNGSGKKSSTGPPPPPVGTKSMSGSRRLAQVGLAVVRKLSTASSTPSASKRPSLSSAGSNRLPDVGHDPFTGQWTCTGTWGLEEFLKKLGTPYMQRRLALSAPWPTWEFAQNGNHFHFKNKTVLGEIVEEFIVDGPEYSMRDGRKQQLTCQAYWRGKTLIIKRHGPQGPFQEEREISGDGLLMQFVLRSLDGSGTSWGRNFKRSGCC